jgi:hypothetical protein
MKSLFRFALVVVAASVILIESCSVVGAQEPSPLPPGNRREVLEVLRHWGVFTRKPHVLYVGPFTSESWVVALKFPDGTKENYSVNMITKDCSKVCHH